MNSIIIQLFLITLKLQVEASGAHKCWKCQDPKDKDCQEKVPEYCNKTKEHHANITYGCISLIAQDKNHPDEYYQKKGCVRLLSNDSNCEETEPDIKGQCYICNETLCNSLTPKPSGTTVCYTCDSNYTCQYLPDIEICHLSKAIQYSCMTKLVEEKGVMVMKGGCMMRHSNLELEEFCALANNESCRFCDKDYCNDFFIEQTTTAAFNMSGTIKYIVFSIATDNSFSVMSVIGSVLICWVARNC